MKAKALIKNREALEDIIKRIEGGQYVSFSEIAQVAYYLYSRDSVHYFVARLDSSIYLLWSSGFRRFSSYRELVWHVCGTDKACQERLWNLLIGLDTGKAWREYVRGYG
jgi:hypothetical protein